MADIPSTRRIFPAVLLCIAAVVAIVASVYIIIGGAYTTNLGGFGEMVGIMLIFFGALALLVGAAAVTAGALALRGSKAAAVMATAISGVLVLVGVPAISTYVRTLADGPTDPLPYVLTIVGIVVTLFCCVTAAILLVRANRASARATETALPTS